jgi:hypothetical protein
MSDEPESGFTVRDRRRVHAEPAPEPTLAPAPTPLPTPESVEEAAPALEYDGAEGAENGPPDVYSLQLLFLREMQTLAYLWMGLIPDPTTGQTVEDLQQARTAIDTAAFLASQLEAVVSPEERLPLRAMIQDMQVQFVERSRG